MYESITYEELKSLPREQKIEALKELKSLYPTQKKIAEKLGVNPANIYNMIAKYMKEDKVKQSRISMARKTVKKETVSKGESTRATGGQVIRSGGEARGNAGGTGRIAGDSNKSTVATGEDSKSVGADIGYSRPEISRMMLVGEQIGDTENNMLITVSKNLTGEEAQSLFVGFSSIFLKNHSYGIEVRISEK